ncbi:MAG: hypothetical protein AAGE98_01625 [Actinomycetota bacterium]
MTTRRLTLSLAALALLAGACSGGDEADASVGVATLDDVETETAATETDPTETDTELDADEAALAFSACMREQGLDFPDIGVDAEGNPDLRDAFVSSGITPGSEDFQSGMAACGEILQTAGFGGGGGRAGLADNPEITDAFVEFSACVRDAGYDVGDLTLGGPGGGQGAGAGQGAGDGQGQRGQGQGQGGFGDRGERIAEQLGLDDEDPAVVETIDQCMPIIDTALAGAGVGQPGGQ